MVVGMEPGVCRGVVWSVDEVATAAADALADAAARLEEDQSPFGLDRLGEVELHPLLASGLERSGWGVLREVLYPGEGGRRVRESERLRCDLVLGPAGMRAVRDEVRIGRRVREAAGGLFEQVARREEPARAEGIDPGEAMWVEVKVVGQYCYEAGVPGPNRSYAGDLVAAGRDAKKLAGGRGLVHGCVLVALFAGEERIARHDLVAAVHRWVDRDWPVSTTAIEVRPIRERIGNTVVAVMAARVRCLGGH